MRSILIIFIKDWRLFLRDKLALLLTFVVPVAIATVIGFTVGGMASGDIQPLDVAIIDLDQTPKTKKLVDDLSSLDILTAHILDPAEDPVEDVIASVSKGQIPALILIEKGFTDGKEGSRLRFINDPGHAISVQIIYQTLIGKAMEIKGKDLIVPKVEEWLKGKGASEDVLKGVRNFFDSDTTDFSSMFDEQKKEETKSDNPEGGSIGGFMSDEDAAKMGIVNEEVVGEKIDNGGYAQAVAGMAVMFAFFSLANGAASLFEERDSGTLKRLLLCPIGMTNILIGKTLNIIVMASIQLIFLFLAGMMIFSLDIFRDPLHLLAFILATAFMASGVGLLLASIASNAQTAGGLSTLFILVMVSVGGAMFPSEFMPVWMQAIGKFTPVYWAMQGFQGYFWYQRPFSEQVDLLLIVLLWGAAFMAIGIWIFKKKLSVK